MDVPGLSVRDGLLTVRANFEQEALEGAVSYRILFPIGFRVSYEEAYNLLCRREEDTLVKLGCSLDRARQITSEATSDLCAIEQFNSVLLSHNCSAPPPDPAFCAAFDVADRALRVKSVKVNDCLAPFTLVPYLEDCMISRRGAVPFLPGDRHSLLEYDCDIVPRLDQQRSCSLLVSIPMVVLRLSLLKMRSNESGATAPDSALSTIGVISFALQVTIEFELAQPRALDSCIFFTEYLYQPDMRKLSILKSAPMLITRRRGPLWPDAKPWFPSAPTQGNAIPWVMQFEIPEHLTNLANGAIAEERVRVSPEDQTRWKVTTYRTECLPSQIFWIAGPLKKIYSTDAMLMPFNTRGSVPQVTFYILPGFEKRLRVSVCHLARTIELINSWIGLPPLREAEEMSIGFLPCHYFGEFEMSLMDRLPRHPISTKNHDAIYNDRRLMKFRGLISKNVCVLPFDELHDHDLIGFRSRIKKLNIVEALLSVWMSPNAPAVLCSNNLWVHTSLRKFLRHLIAGELFGKIEASVLLQRYLDTYLLMTERGYERYPLSAGGPTPPVGGGGRHHRAGREQMLVFNSYSLMYDIKTYLVLPALECLVISLSCSKNFVSPMIFRNFVFSFIKKSKPLSKFIDRLRFKVLNEFVKKKLHKTAVTRPQEADQPPPPAPTTPEELDLSLYRGHSLYDIEECVSDIVNFEKAYIYGIGCGILTVSSWYELQRKTGQLEVLKLRADQHPLSSPEILEDGMFSYYHPAVNAITYLINDILAHPQWLHISGGGEAADARNIVRQSLLQSSSVVQYLEQLSFDVNALRGNPLELIVKDNKLAFGYGYIGSCSAPLCGGRGTLFNSLVKQATGSWGNLTPEQRSAMASDSSSMELLVSSTPNAMRAPVASLGGAQEWVIDMLAWNAIKQSVSLHECIPKQSKRKAPILTSTDHLNATHWLESLRKDSHHQFTNLPLWRGEIARHPFLNRLPESATSSATWPVKIAMRVYEDSFVTEDLVSIRPASAGVSFFTLRDQSIVKKMCLSLPRALGVQLPSQVAFSNGEVCKIQGPNYGHDDVQLLNSSCTDNVKAQFTGALGAKPSSSVAGPAASSEANATNRSTDDPGGSGVLAGRNAGGMGTGTAAPGTAGLTPILWMRPSEDSFIIGRIERFQSLSNWLNQLGKDTCVRAQLEAARALGTLALEHLAAFDGLVTASFNVRLHPYVRRACLTGLVNAMTGQAVGPDKVEKVVVQRLLPLFQESMCPGLINQDPMPPIYSSLAYEQLVDLYSSLSMVRNNVNETPESVWNFFSHCLTHWPFPVDVRLGSRFETDKFTSQNFDETLPLHQLIAKLIESLPNLTFQQPPQNFNWNTQDVSASCDDRTEQIFLSVYTRSEMEKKLPTSERLVTLAYLTAIARIPMFQFLARLKNIPYDPLFCYMPVARPVPLAIRDVLPLPLPKQHRNSWMYLSSYRGKALNFINSVQGVGIQHVCQQICDSLNYTDFTVQAKAMHTTLSLILQGRLLPPIWILESPLSNLQGLPCSSPNLDADGAVPPQPKLSHVLRDFLTVTSEPPYGCVWIDNLQLQYSLQRQGLTVLYCIQLLVSLEYLLPFSNDSGLIVASWAAFLEALESAPEAAPSALLAYLLETSSVPVITGDLKPARKKVPKSDAKQRNFATQDVGADPAFQETPQHVVVPEPISVTSVPDFPDYIPEPVDLSPMAAEPDSAMLPRDEDELLPEIPGPDLDHELSELLPDEGPDGDHQTIEDMLMDELAEDVMMDGVNNWELDTIGEHFSATPDDISAGALRGDGGMSDGERLPNLRKLKKKKKHIVTSPPTIEGPPLLVPPVVTVYEILFRYLHVAAPALGSIADQVVYYVREVIHFLYGSGVPSPVRSCTEHLSSLMSTLTAHQDMIRAQHDLMKLPPADSGGEDEPMRTRVEMELMRIQDYVVHTYQTLAPATTNNAEACAKQYLKIVQQGIPVRAISSYDRVEITCWSFSKIQKHWPLPLKLSWQNIAQRMIACLMEHPSGHWFIHPVNAKANPSYYKIIDTPMWFLKVSEKLRDQEYGSFVELRNDIFTIFRNCRKFNAPMTLILLDCDILQSLSYQLLHFADRLLHNTDSVLT